MGHSWPCAQSSGYHRDFRKSRRFPDLGSCAGVLSGNVRVISIGRIAIMRRLLAAMLAAGTIAMSILQPAHAQTNAPTDTHFCPPWNYYNTAEERCVSPPASH